MTKREQQTIANERENRNKIESFLNSRLFIQIYTHTFIYARGFIQFYIKDLTFFSVLFHLFLSFGFIGISFFLNFNGIYLNYYRQEYFHLFDSSMIMIIYRRGKKKSQSEKKNKETFKRQ